MTATICQYPNHSFAPALLAAGFNPALEGVKGIKGLKKYINRMFPAPEKSHLRGACWEVICEWMIARGHIKCLPDVIGQSTEAEVYEVSGIKQGFHKLGGRITGMNTVGIDDIVYRQETKSDGSKVIIIDLAQFKYDSQGVLDLGTFPKTLMKMIEVSDETTSFVFISSTDNNTAAKSDRDFLNGCVEAGLGRRAEALGIPDEQNRAYVKQHAQNRVHLLVGSDLNDVMTPDNFADLSDWLLLSIAPAQHADLGRRIKEQCEDILKAKREPNPLELAAFRALVDKWHGNDPDIRGLLTKVAASGIPVTTFEAKLEKLKEATGFDIAKEMEIYRRSFGTSHVPPIMSPEKLRHQLGVRRHVWHEFRESALQDVAVMCAIRFRNLSKHWMQIVAMENGGDLYNPQLVELVNQAKRDRSIDGDVGEQWKAIAHQHVAILDETHGCAERTLQFEKPKIEYNPYRQVHSVNLYHVDNCSDLDGGMFYGCEINSDDYELRQLGRDGLRGKEISYTDYDSFIPVFNDTWRNPLYRYMGGYDGTFYRAGMSRQEGYLAGALRDVIEAMEDFRSEHHDEMPAKDMLPISKAVSDIQKASSVDVSKGLYAAYCHRHVIRTLIQNQRIPAVDKLTEEFAAIESLCRTKTFQDGTRVDWTDTACWVTRPDGGYFQVEGSVVTGKTLDAKGRTLDAIKVNCLNGETNGALLLVADDGIQWNELSEDDVVWHKPGDYPADDVESPSADGTTPAPRI